jgi:hypothetical protein
MLGPNAAEHSCRNYTGIVRREQDIGPIAKVRMIRFEFLLPNTAGTPHFKRKPRAQSERPVGVQRKARSGSHVRSA